jgi:hypothetical protein
MVQNKDSRVEVARMQGMIMDRLGLSTDNLIFEYSQTDNGVRLDLVTVNPRHNQSFLFHTTRGIDKLDALEKMVVYVQSNKDGEDTYTIQWTTRGDNELHTSYFRARNIYEALDKLYYGRDMNAISVYIVKLNPMS